MVGCIYTKASLKVSKKPSLHVALIGGHDSTAVLESWQIKKQSPHMDTYLNA